MRSIDNLLLPGGSKYSLIAEQIYLFVGPGAAHCDHSLAGARRQGLSHPP